MEIENEETGKHKRGRPRLGPKKKSTEYFQHSNSDERIPRAQKTVNSSRNNRYE